MIDRLSHLIITESSTKHIFQFLLVKKYQVPRNVFSPRAQLRGLDFGRVSRPPRVSATKRAGVHYLTPPPPGEQGSRR